MVEKKSVSDINIYKYLYYLHYTLNIKLCSWVIDCQPLAHGRGNRKSTCIHCKKRFCFVLFFVLMRLKECLNVMKPDENVLISPCVAQIVWALWTCLIVKVLPEVAHVIEAVLTSVWLTSLIRQRPLSIRALILLLCVGREGVLNAAAAAAAAAAAVTHPLNAARPLFPVQLPAG